MARVAVVLRRLVDFRIPAPQDVQPVFVQLVTDAAELLMYTLAVCFVEGSQVDKV